MKKNLLIIFVLSLSVTNAFAQQGIWRRSLDVTLNGTLKNYKDGSGTGDPMSGTNLGALTAQSNTLTMSSPHLFSYKNSPCDVTAASFSYVIFKTGTTRPMIPLSNATNLAFMADCFTAAWPSAISGCGGGGDQQWGSPTPVVDLKAAAAAIDPMGGSFTVGVKHQTVGNCGVIPFLTDPGWIDMTFTATAAALLPVKLSRFVAKQQDKNVNITWTTETESNTKNFEVEKSNDSRIFSSIAVVDAKGFSQEQNVYNVKDVSATQTSFYRLKMNDRDGKFTYSKTIAIGNNAANVLNVSPNPVNNNATLSIDNQGIETAIVQIFNVNGQLQKTISQNLTKDFNQINLDFNNLGSGVYFISISDENGNQIAQERMIKE